uniref:Alpha-1,6-mannosyl-glycoprotein 6-beta-N-acetylglucosaminyltransferase n=1 Tax=Angiostrongylus cantonensis TaxID=6313 RepID=A0A0K0DGV3_ANGCA
MTDELAIVTKAKENIIFAMSALSEQQRYGPRIDPINSHIKSLGLRVMLFVNASDYLSTSEAVGVRLTIHDKDEFPFPGCYRTCFQQLIIDRCGCGDPRFPSIGEHKLCEVFNKRHRTCLEESIQELSDIRGSFKCR